MDMTNLVHWACEMGNENILKECIEMKYNLNEGTNLCCHSPLMIAVKKANSLPIIELLVNNGADLQYVNYDGKNVSHLTENDEYLLFLQNIGVEKIENTNQSLSKLALEILNNKECSVTTKKAVNQVDTLGLTPFLWAILFKRQNHIDYYLKLGADVNQPGKTGVTPLMWATLSGNYDIVKRIVKNGANINQLDNYGLPAIAYFHSKIPINIMDYLFRIGAKNDPCTSGNGRSSLMVAAIRNKIINRNKKNYFDYFLNKNANVNFIDSDGNTALSYVILNKNTTYAAKLIAKGANIDLCGPKGKTPLAWSVFLNNPGVTQFLLDNGAHINFTDHQGQTALYYAQKYEYKAIANLLEDNGGTINPKVASNQNIFSAIPAKDMNLVKTLLNNLNIYNINTRNETVIEVAVQVADLDVINLLLEKENQSFVHIALPAAIQTENIQLVELLLKKGAYVNRVYQKTNQTPLMQAINQQNEGIVKLLIEFNADVHSRPSPFRRALELGLEKIVEILVEASVDDLKSFLQIAIEENNIQVIMFLLKKGVDPSNAVERLNELAKKFDALAIALENYRENQTY